MQNDPEESSNMYINSSSRRSTYQYRQNIPPPRPMTLTPNTQRTSSTRQSLLQSSFPEEEEDNEQLDEERLYSNIYYSPLRISNQPSSFFNTTNIHNNNSFIETDHVLHSHHQNSHLSNHHYPSSPSTVLHDRLLDESRRLDKLQQDILFIKKQSSLLANYGSLSKQQHEKEEYGEGGIDITMKSPIGHIQPSKSTSSIMYHTRNNINNNNDNNKRHNTYGASHLHNTIYNNNNNNNNNNNKRKFNQEHTHSMTPYSIQHVPPSTSTPLSSYISSPSISTPHFKTKSQKKFSSEEDDRHHNREKTTINDSQQDKMNYLLSDISKAKLKSTKIISTPNGSRIKNKFWSEIHEKERDLPTQQQEDEEETNFWMDKKGPQSRLTERLHQTLDQEIDQANDKSILLEQQQRQQHVKSNSFQLIPKPTFHFMEELQHTIQSKKIDGDNWTFNGQNYIVDETKYK
ncbi:hypothetical protein BJ944DRAFT_131049 [Cunninghamella echinulata]|nr:hypothetical protein BJ944DRAFT_131049 [Cunninghamella echinulata]